MAETIKIGGELESTATGNVVAAASAIKDKTRNKYQSEINDDVARHETEIHGTGGIDSRVTDLETMEQIVIAGGEAQIAQGSDFTNPDATKRAKIPTVGAIVDGLNDGIYDVSKRNPTGGPNSDGKFTLEYILSNVNTLIPASWRKGGMNIKFVQSSDNKYVQYRLMKNQWSTTVADWQGVDDVPTAGSDNLVKSGGIAAYIRPIKDFAQLPANLYLKFTDLDLLSKAIWNIGFIGTDGNVGINNNWRYTPYYIKVNPGAIVTTSPQQSYPSGPVWVACYDSNYNFLLDISGKAPSLPTTFEIPEGTKYIRCCYAYSGYSGGNLKTFKISEVEFPIIGYNTFIETDLSEILSRLSNIEENEILANPLLNVDGYIKISDGNIQTGAYYSIFAYSEFIPLKFYDKFEIKNILSRSDFAYAALYTESKNCIITFVYQDGDETDLEFNTEELLNSYPTAYYIRFCGGSSKNSQGKTIINGVFVDYKHILNLINNINSNIDAINGDIDAINGDIDAIYKNISRYIKFENIITQEEIEIQADAGYQDKNGVIQGKGTDQNWFNTQFIRVEQNDTIICENLGGQGTDVMTVGFFDVNKTCLKEESHCQKITSQVSFTVTNPNIVYVRFSGRYAAWFEKSGRISMSLNLPINKALDAAVEEIEEIKSQLPSLNNDNAGIVSDIEHIICYGQSLSQGDWESHKVSYTQKYNSLMFTGTIRVWEYRDQEHKYDALIPAVETVFEYQQGETPVGAIRRGETPCCGTGEKAMELIIADGFNINDYQYQLLLSAPGMGGYAIAYLRKGTSIYNRLLEDVQAGKTLANAAGKTFVCRGVIWIQGESDNGATYEYYYNAMNKLFDDLNNDIKSITGQTERVHFFLYQMRCYDWYYTGFHYPNVPLAQLGICKDRDDCHMVGPIYQMPLIGDYTHFTAEGSKWYGGYIGKVWKKVIVDGERWLGGVYLKSCKVAGNSIILQFNVPNPPLTFDTVNVPDRGISKGFQIREVDDFEQNSYLDIITNVEIIRPDTVKITCSESPLGKRLTYAINGTATPSDRHDMGSGNLRDSCTDVFNFPITENGQDVEHKMFNWCPLFDQILE